jgi:hypothetical protein
MASKSHPSTETAQMANGAVETPSAFKKLLRRMAEMAVLDTTANRSASGEDINAILIAESETEMWDADELDKYNATKLSGCDLQTTWFEVRFGDGTAEVENPVFVYEGKQMYLLVHSFRITNAKGEDKTIKLPEVGEEFVWNTSARNIVGKLFWMLDHGWFDTIPTKVARFTIKGKKVRNGGTVEKLKEFTGTPIVTTAHTVTEDTPF